MPNLWFLAGLLCGVLLTVVYAALIAGGVADELHPPQPAARAGGLQSWE